jgi:hypothetical protein
MTKHSKTNSKYRGLLDNLVISRLQTEKEERGYLEK